MDLPMRVKKNRYFGCIGIGKMGREVSSGEEEWRGCEEINVGRDS